MPVGSTGSAAMPPADGSASAAIASSDPRRSGNSDPALASCLCFSRPPKVPPLPNSTAFSTALKTFFPLYPSLPRYAIIAAGAVTPPAASAAVVVAMPTSTGSSGLTIKKSVKSLAVSP